MANEMLDSGKALLEAVALAIARDHGLSPAVEWEDHGYEWLLRLVDERHAVRVVFSPDEIAFFAEAQAVDREAKMKIRNAFASLSM